MKDEQKVKMPVVGGSSLLVIFSVLCLVTFALLGLSTALADQRLSEASVRAMTDYYQADSHAEQIFAQLRNGEMPEGVTADQGVYSYSCPISDNQVLAVELYRQDEKWTVLRWQSVNQAEYEEELLEVWDGDPIF